MGHKPLSRKKVNDLKNMLDHQDEAPSILTSQVGDQIQYITRLDNQKFALTEDKSLAVTYPYCRMEDLKTFLKQAGFQGLEIVKL